MISADEKHFKELIFFLNSLSYAINDAIDEGRLIGKLRDDLKKKAKNILKALTDDEIELNTIKESLERIHDIASLFFNQLDEDEKDMHSEYIGRGSSRLLKKVLNYLENLLKYEKVRNTLYSFAEEILNELEDKELENINSYSNIKRMDLDREFNEPS